MAMNFKVFDNSEKVAEYTADILRKQFNNNPTTIAGFHLGKEHAPVFDELKKNVENHAVDFSQINILDYDDNHSYYEALCQQAFIQFLTKMMQLTLSQIRLRLKKIRKTDNASPYD